MGKKYTIFTIFDDKKWTKAKNLANTLGLKVGEMQWKALEIYMEEKCPVTNKTDGKPVIKVDTLIDKTKHQIKEKIRQLDANDIDKQQDWAKMYLNCLNEERMKRFER